MAPRSVLPLPLRLHLPLRLALWRLGQALLLHAWLLLLLQAGLLRHAWVRLLQGCRLRLMPAEHLKGGHHSSAAGPLLLCLLRMLWRMHYCGCYRCGGSPLLQCGVPCRAH